MKKISQIIIAALVIFTMQAAHAADGWQSGFNMPGFDGAVNAVAVDSAGNLYAGGWFTSVNGAGTNYSFPISFMEKIC